MIHNDAAIHQELVQMSLRGMITSPDTFMDYTVPEYAQKSWINN